MILEQISNTFWSETFWLPSGYTWKDFEPTPGVNKPNFKDLYQVPVLAFLLICIRHLFERFLATPFCLYLGIKDNLLLPVESNSICERVFTTVSKKPSEEQINGLAKQLGWPEVKVSKWFQKRRKATQRPLLNKATESCWRCVFYFWLFLFGAYTLLPTEWFYNTRKWMTGYIREQDFNVYLKTYYLMELSFYTSLLFSQFIDTKRKDFYQMLLHHIVTIMLIFSSFASGHHRIGVVIMFLHDASDYWLEAAKIFNYAKKQKCCDRLFIIFAVVFFLTRWVYYPLWVLDAFIIKCREIIGYWIAFYILSLLLVILQVLHIFWGILILRMVYKFTSEGKVRKDERSEDESSGDETSQVSSSSKKKK